LLLYVTLVTDATNTKKNYGISVEPEYGSKSPHRNEGENFIQTIKLFFLTMLPNEDNGGRKWALYIEV
jgi:hypothetical protein